SVAATAIPARQWCAANFPTRPRPEGRAVTKQPWTRWATFTPKRLDTLRPEARAHIGKTYLWHRMWTITEDDGGPYVGQTAWQPDPEFGVGWAPDEDLTPADPPTREDRP